MAKTNSLNFLYALSLVWTVYSQPSFGQEQNSADIVGQVRFVERLEHKTDGTDQHMLRGQLRIDGWVNVSESGCIKLRGRVTTGDAYNNEWFHTGVGKGEADIQLGIRHLYVDMECVAKNVRIEAGSLPVRTNGSLGLTSYGWIDGVRVSFADPNHGTEYTLSAGEISDPKNPNLLKRNYQGPNHIQFEVKQRLSEKVSGHASISYYEDLLFTRGGVDWIVQEYTKWIQSVGVEVIGQRDQVIGGMIYSNFDLKKWKVRAFVAEIDPDPTDEEKLALLLKNFFGYGRNYYLEASRELNPTLNFNLRFRVGDAGKLMELGLTQKF